MGGGGIHTETTRNKVYKAYSEKRHRRKNKKNAIEKKRKTNMIVTNKKKEIHNHADRS
jgi:hypothetical protein